MAAPGWRGAERNVSITVARGNRSPYQGRTCARTSRTHVLRAGLDRFANPGVGAAPADVAQLVEVRVGDVAPLRPGLPDLRDGRHDLAGLTVPALRHVVLQPGL